MQSGLIAASAAMSSPIAAHSPATTLRALATALAASGAFESAGIVDVEGARRLQLFLGYQSAGSGGTGGYPSIIVLGSAADEQPAAADEAWYPLVVDDGTVTAGALAGALPAGSDFAAAPNWGVVLQQPLELTLPAATTNSEKIKGTLGLDVTALRWVQVLVAERGATAAPGALGVLYSVGA